MYATPIIWTSTLRHFKITKSWGNLKASQSNMVPLTSPPAQNAFSPTPLMRIAPIFSSFSHSYIY